MCSTLATAVQFGQLFSLPGLRPNRLSEALSKIGAASGTSVMDLKLRCSAGGCECRNFSASPTNKESLRICDSCNHSWITHLLEKLLTSRDDALSVFDVCSLALYGTHALPIRLKIVIERLLATLTPDEIDKILRSFGWSPQDLARGYMIQDSRGGLLGRWSMLPREEEILILQQFLRFQATRALSFALLREDFPIPPPTPNNHPPKTPPQNTNHQLIPQPPPPVKNESVKNGNIYNQDMLIASCPSQGPPEPQPSQILNLSTQSSASEDEAEGERYDLAVDLSSKSITSHNSIKQERSPRQDVRNSDKDFSNIRKSSMGQKRQWNPIQTAQLVNPATGKRRVQCSVCLKTFCDKGALKIHFSAVHLREMHKCTVSGCNMMFSSRRSRNRHSANPNPKLHSPHLRRKISPHDGRTSQPIINLSNSMLLSPIRFPPFLPVMPQSHSADANVKEEPNDNFKETDERMDDDFEHDLCFSSPEEEEEENESVENTKEEPKNDGARKRKLKNPVRLPSVPDDSNDDFCCYDDGTEVSHEEEEEKEKKHEVEEDHLGRLEALPIFASPHHSDSSGTPKSEDEENNGLGGSSPGSVDGEIPIDRENPRRCLACGKVFQNHFGVKTHYQNVHLKLMHKCTVDGCNAAFPSKRSRDRHSSNLNLHRKLLSTSDISNGSSSDLKERSGIFNPYFFHNGSGNHAVSPPMNANHPPWNPFLPFHMFPAVFGAPPPPPMDNPPIVDCRFCGKSFEEGSPLRAHMESAHAQEGIQCRNCSNLFFSSKKFESHSKICVEHP